MRDREQRLGGDAGFVAANEFGEPGDGFDQVELPHERPTIEDPEAVGRGGGRGGGPVRVITISPDLMRHPAFEPGKVNAPVSKSMIDAQHQYLRNLKNGAAGGIGSGLISAQAQQVLGRERERYATRTPDDDRLVVANDWFNALPEHMQVLEEARRNWLEAANYMRRGETGWSAEKVSGNTGLEKVNEGELAALYTHYPGLRKAMELYVQMTRQPERFTFENPLRNGRQFTLCTYEGDTEIEGIRNELTSWLVEDIELVREAELARTLDNAEISALRAEGLITEYAKMQARAAEQLALNILYSLGFWNGEGWLSPGQGLLINVPLRGVGRPMDFFVTLAYSAAKERSGPDEKSKQTNVGTLGTWINNFLIDAFRSAYGRRLSGLQMADIVYERVPETGGNWRKFWTVQKRRDGKCVVRVPEGLPIELMKPALQGVIVKTEGRGRSKVEVSLADMLERGVRIDWDRVAHKVGGFIGSSNYYLKQNGELFDFLRGKKEAKDWLSLPGVLSVLGKANDTRLRMWLEHLYGAFDVEVRDARIYFGKGRMGRLRKEEYLRVRTKSRKRPLKRGEILFPWE